MIILNGSKFAETETEFLNSLFSSGGTCKGYAKRFKRRIVISNMQKEKIGVINRFGILCCATKTVDGWWYNSATIKEVGEYDYAKQVEEVARYGVITHCDKGDPVYSFCNSNKY